ncbi:MAG: FTR1 family protein [Anaerolineae bacterium]
MNSVRYWVGSIVFVLLVGVAVPALAQGDAPQLVAEQIRQQLFDVQGDLLLNNAADAQTEMTNVYALYQTEFRPLLIQALPIETNTLDSLFDRTITAVGQGNQLQLAVLRGNIWTEILNASSLLAQAAIEADDATSGARWLLLREFRSSTKFSRPGADATLAMQAFAHGQQSEQETLTAIRNDLLDTYQSQLTAALAAAEEANRREFTLRRAEETGLAAGYFSILAQSFAEQQGEAALEQALGIFDALNDAAANGDQDGFEVALESAHRLLKGFRAAPLSAAEQARRAGQLLRFVSLVPVEYERGVQNGVVIKDIEIQEALTFAEGSTAAFNDILPVLEQRDAQASARAAVLLNGLNTDIRTTVDPAVLQANVAEIQAILATVMPAEWQQIDSSSDMDVILSILDQVEAAVEANQYDLAESARLEAYGLLELGIEQRLRGFAPALALKVEGLFWQGSIGDSTGGSVVSLPGLAFLVANRAPLSEIKTTLTALRTAFDEAQTVLSTGSTSPAVVVGNSAIIVFREGLEAVLILASLLASLRTGEERQFRRPIIQGAALAFVATGVTWWIANQILTVLLPLGERLEVIVSLIAIGVLLLITNWFFHKVYWTGWMANFHTRKRHLIGGVAVVTLSQAAGLVILGFTSIYREGFETVLFLQSLVLEAGLGIVLQGVALGLLGVTVVGLIVFALQVRLPYKKMLIVTGVMIGFVLLTMVGHTVQAAQTVGWLPISPVANLNLPLWMGQWFGLYATWQGIGLQCAAAVFVIGSYFWAEFLNQRRRHEAVRPADKDNALRQKHVTP